MIYNNGYVVKGLHKHELYTQSWDSYFGIGSYTSWPLQYLDGFESINCRIEELYLNSDCGYFLDCKYKEKYPRSLCFVQDETFILEYINICNSIHIPTIVLCMESEIPNYVKGAKLKKGKTLGWDCVAQAYYSYLDELYEIDSDQILIPKLNENCLFDNIDDVKRFITLRESVIESGICLENSFEPIPAKLSLVQI